ncbi:hypothetical protein HID58_029032, partial [Brassica napus]
MNMATEEEADEYNINEVDWGEEPGHSWEDQNYGDGSEEEADEYNISEVDLGEEPGYSWEDQNYGDGSEEDDQCRESRAEDGYEEGPCRKGEDPRNYLQWEEDMERYFKCNSIPKGEYLSYGLGQLTEKAQRYWKREEKYLILNLVDMATEEEADEYNINEVDWGEEPGHSWEDQNYGDGSEEEADEYNISEVDLGEEPGYSWEDQNYGDGSEEDDQCRESRAEDGYEEGPCRKGEDPRNYLQWEEDMERYFKCNSIPKGEYLSYGLGQLTEKAQRYWKREEKNGSVNCFIWRMS